ncbi:hypothetical protein QYF61_025905, partial [Mycteria americana]
MVKHYTRGYLAMEDRRDAWDQALMARATALNTLLLSTAESSAPVYTERVRTSPFWYNKEQKHSSDIAKKEEMSLSNLTCKAFFSNQTECFSQVATWLETSTIRINIDVSDRLLDPNAAVWRASSVAQGDLATDFDEENCLSLVRWVEN